MSDPDPTSQPAEFGHAEHRKLAVDLFNHVWELMDKSQRSQHEDDEMLHAAHASVYHWSKAGTPLNAARGEWQVSRVYAVLQRPEPALFHARRSLEICEQHQFGDFDLAFAYEAMARAYAVAGNHLEMRKYLALGRQAGENIAEVDDKNYFLTELNSIGV